MATTTVATKGVSDDEVAVATIPMGYAEYRDWYDKEAGRRGEWVDGQVIPFMTTTDRHQRIMIFLLGILINYVDLRRAGRVYSQTFELRSREGAAREPDILVLLNEHLDRLDDLRVTGAADVAVEIISPDSVTRDRHDKFVEYAAAGVPEYWLVDPREAKEQLDVYRLDAAGRYIAVERDEDGRIGSVVLPGVWLDPRWLTMTELPSVTRLGLEMAGVALPDH